MNQSETSKVLLVDDDPFYLHLLAQKIAVLFGDKLQTLMASDGETALQIAKTENLCLLLMDFNMPQLSGLAITQRMQADEALRYVPIIIITGSEETATICRALDAGAVDFMNKDCTEIELKARVSSAIRLSRAHQNLMASHAEIKSQHDTIAQQNEALTRLNKLKDQVVSILSHDVRSPINSLSGLLSVFLAHVDAFDKAEIKEHLQNIHSSLTGVSELLDNLLKWSAAQLQQRALRRECVSLSAMVERNSALFKTQLDGKLLQLVFEQKGDAAFYTDPDVLDFVLRNLISNAIKFTPENGLVSVKVNAQAHSVRLSVSDTGVGMRADKLAAILAGAKVKSSLGTAKEKGTGLGLSLVSAYIEQLGGRLSGESTEQVGTVWHVDLPNIGIDV